MDPSASPFEDDGAGSATYDVLAYSLTFNDVDVTLPIIGNGTGQGVAVVNDVDALEAGVFIDGLFFFAAIPAGVSGLDRMLIAALTGPLDMFTDITLPADLTFLSQTTQRSLVLEGPDDDEVLAAVGSLIATGALDVPEPMSVALLAFGLAATLVRARGPRRFTKSC